MSISLRTQEKTKNKFNELTSLDFISVGLACHAICLLEKANMLHKLQKGLSEKEILCFPNPSLIRASIATLVNSEVVSYESGCFALTSLGISLLEDLGSIMLPFHGYRKLLAKQYDLLTQPGDWSEKDIDFPSIAEASSNFGQKDLLPLLHDLFENLIKPKGTICDLGCGIGDKLSSICSRVNKPGLGIEKDKRVVKKSKTIFSGRKEIEIIRGDIKNLTGVWEDVDVAMINFVYHDFSIEECSKFLNNLKSNFPRLKYLVISDIVSFSETHRSIFPGFDYAHGFQGIIPLSYSEITRSFESEKFSIKYESAVVNMPNTYVWVIQPKG